LTSIGQKRDQMATAYDNADLAAAVQEWDAVGEVEAEFASNGSLVGPNRVGRSNVARSLNTTPVMTFDAAFKRLQADMRPVEVLSVDIYAGKMLHYSSTASSRRSSWLNGDDSEADGAVGCLGHVGVPVWLTAVAWETRKWTPPYGLRLWHKAGNAILPNILLWL
jgi:hypothetical protein